MNILNFQKYGVTHLTVGQLFSLIKSQKKKIKAVQGKHISKRFIRFESLCLFEIQTTVNIAIFLRVSL